MDKLTLKDIPLKQKKVLMRVDFNVPLDKNRHITDDTRIVAALPSIKYILEQDAALILMSHLGRPKGKVNSEFSLEPCARRLMQLLGKEVLLAPDCIGKEVEKLASQLKPGQILLLENLRFHPGEENPDLEPSFTSSLARLGDVYVNDAFGTAHRAHASTALIAKYFPEMSAAGFLMEKEIQFLGQHLHHPRHPFYAIIGGAKVSSKIGALKTLLKKVDGLFIGGGMAFTFIKAMNISIGNSIHQDEYLETAKEIISECEKNNIKLIFPEDIVIVNENDLKKYEEMSLKDKGAIPKISSRVVDKKDGIPVGFLGVDIGPKTIELFSKELASAQTVLWNGPLGIFEINQFAKGTEAIAKIVSGLSNATTIIGGGDSVSAIQKMGVADKISHLSTGGGASLEYIEFGTLPGIEALSE